MGERWDLCWGSYLCLCKREASVWLERHLVVSLSQTSTLQQDSWSAPLLWVFANGSDLREEPQACTELTAELRGELKEEGGDVVQHWNRKSELQQEEAFSHNVTLNLLTDSRHKNIISCKHCVWMFILKHRDRLLSLEIIENEIGVRSFEVISLQCELYS